MKRFFNYLTVLASSAHLPQKRQTNREMSRHTRILNEEDN